MPKALILDMEVIYSEGVCRHAAFTCPLPTAKWTRSDVAKVASVAAQHVPTRRSVIWSECEYRGEGELSFRFAVGDGNGIGDHEPFAAKVVVPCLLPLETVVSLADWQNLTARPNLLINRDRRQVVAVPHEATRHLCYARAEAMKRLGVERAYELVEETRRAAREEAARLYRRHRQNVLKLVAADRA